MALNPFFLQGSPGEQRLIQELINEQLKIYGVEVSYIPRKYVRRETIIEEVTASKFNDNFSIEAYIANYEGYGGSGDILTKFGMSLRDELTLIISKERFEDFITPFLEGMPDDEVLLASRPKEGDLVYFPLGKRLFEIKFVEHEQPFYQLGKTYVYELKCELFEYEDEVGGWEGMNTTVEEIDTTLQNQGYITTLELFSFGSQSEATVSTTNGYIKKIYLNNDGYDYSQSPVVAISSAPLGGTNAEAVAITTCRGGVCSIDEILIKNSGSGYTTIPSITITDSTGVGAAATCEIVTGIGLTGIAQISIANTGSGYVTPPTVVFSNPVVGSGVTALGSAFINNFGNVSAVYMRDAGVGYTSAVSVTIASPSTLTGIGTYIFNEVVTGSVSGSKARVKSWDADTNILKIGITSGQFINGENILGEDSSALYTIKTTSKTDLYDAYEQNDEIEEEADQIIDFSESNPFGNY
jgi:hypothetical protein